MEILPQLLVNSLITGSIYALASSGLSLTYGTLKILNFAHGHIMMTGAYLFFMASVQFGWGLTLSSVFTGTAVALLAAASLYIFVLPFTKYNNLLVFVTTLALSIILESVISICFGVNVKSLELGSWGRSFEIADVYITPIQLLIIASALILLTAVAAALHLTPLGRKVRAISEHPHAAESLSINKGRTVGLVFLCGTLLAAFAGIMVGYETNMQPTMGNAYTVKGFAAMLLGGLGNLWGTIISSYILGVVENLSIGLDVGGYSLPAGYKDSFAFMIILFVLLFRPQGIFTKARRVT